MNITHFCNSFIAIESGETRLVCDPWIGVANHGGWHAFPVLDVADVRRTLDEATHVYISHLHSDHFSIELLKSVDLRAKQFIIKKYKNGILQKRLTDHGVTNIVATEPYEEVSLGSMKVVIFPQVESSHSDVPDPINYDLDTSLLAVDESAVFFNQVDNPLSLDSLRDIKSWIEQRYGAISIAALACGAASEYPQCFINIDRGAAAAALIQREIGRLMKFVEVLDSRACLLAGGTYFVPGHFNALNKYIAIPDANDVIAESEKRFPAKKFLCLEGGGSIRIAREGIDDVVASDPGRRFSKANIKAVAGTKRGLQYEYEIDVPSSLTDQEASGICAAEFDKAKPSYERQLARMNLSIKTRVLFKLHNGLKVNDDADLVSAPVCVLSVPYDANTSETDAISLVIHMDHRVFTGCLSRKYSWNQALSGSLCLFERTPNTHEPAALFALNFLVIV